MKGSIPIQGDDFIFNANGYKCGVGIYADADVSFLAMTKEKVIGGGSNTDSNTWEFVYITNDPELEVIKSPYNGDSKKFYTEWLSKANAALKLKVKGDIPDFPVDNILQQLLWLTKFGLAFRSDTNEVYIK
jgi:hypothetical protein